MKKLVVVLAVILLAATTRSQELSQVNFLSGSSLSYFTIRTNQDVLIRIAEDGKVLEYGTEVMADRGNFYAPKLQPFMGRIENYNPQTDSAYAGKVKTIGSTFVTYYSGLEEPFRRGKLRSLGTLNFDYYSDYEDKNMAGKLKQIGSYTLQYYSSFDNQDIRGKLKAIGSMPIAYYTSFDDKYNAGKLKSVGTAQYTWYPQVDRAAGTLKSNNYRQAVGGIIVVLR